MTESSVPTKVPPPPTPKRPFPRQINSRTIVAPAAAFTMALLLFVYARTSIRAAKNNAQRHREADSGGKGLSLLNESRRRHGLADKVDGAEGTVTELGREILGGSSRQGKGSNNAGLEKGLGRSEEDERLTALKGQKGRRSSSND